MTQRPDLPTYHELRQRLQSLTKQLVHAELLGRDSEVRRVAAEGELERLRRVHELLTAESRRSEADALQSRREVQSLRNDLQRARRQAAQGKRDADQALGIALTALRRVRSDLERIESSTAWRLGHGVARAAGQVRMRKAKTPGAALLALKRLDEVIAVLAARLGEVQRPAGEASERPLATARLARETKQLLAQAIRTRLGPAPTRSDWPGVSIVTLSRNAAEQLDPLMEGLRDTDYPTFELIVVDQSSAEDAVQLSERPGVSFPVRILRKDSDAAAAGAVNEAAHAAKHPFLLLIDSDIEPAEQGWLKELAEAVLTGADGEGAVAATRIPRTDPPLRGGDAAERFAVQQRGLVLDLVAGLPVPTPIDVGAPLPGERFGIEFESAAVSSSCLLVSRTSFLGVGGFDGGYGDVLEGVDLALRLRNAGTRILWSGRSVVFCPEDAQESPGASEARSADTAAPGQRRLMERWGPALRREIRLALLRRDRSWIGDRKLNVLVARASGDTNGRARDEATIELRDALSNEGWGVRDLDPGADEFSAAAAGADVVIALTPKLDPAVLPASVIAVAWIVDSPQHWLKLPLLHRYDVLVASSPRAVTVIRESSGLHAALLPPAANPARFAPPADDVRPSGTANARAEISYDDLPAAFHAAEVVIDQAPPDEARAGALGARALAALAAGTPVLTNCRRAAREQFDDEFPVFDHEDQLEGALQELVDSPERAGLAMRYRRRVLAEHTYQHRARRLRQLVEQTEERISFCLKIGAQEWRQAGRWGDLHLARDLERALKRRGHRCLIQVQSEWDNPEGFAYDVAVHVRGRGTYAPRQSQFNVLWLISHPDELSDDEANAYDLVCVASESFAETLAQRLSAPVAVLDQATDPWRFYPDPDPELAHDLVFVGNRRGSSTRGVLEDLLPTDLDLAVWGGGLSEVVDARHFQAEWFPNERLRRIYSSAKVVLCDHWEDMRTQGFASNRLYDAVASGAVVVTDAVAGIDGRFGDAVIRYDDAEDLRATLDRLLSSDGERSRLTADARASVLSAHTFDHRAAALLQYVETYAPGTGHRARVTAE